MNQISSENKFYCPAKSLPKVAIPLANSVSQFANNNLSVSAINYKK